MVVGTYQSVQNDHMSRRISLSVDPRVMSGELSKRDQMWVTDDDLQATYNVSIIKRKF